MTLRILPLLFVIAFSPACGEKKPPRTDPTDVAAVNPKEAFAAGLKLIEGSDGKSDWSGALTKFE